MKVLKISKMIQKLNEQDREKLIKPIIAKGWKMVDKRDAINKQYKFKDFNEAFGFISRIALKAEKLDHHPEWFNVV